MRRGSPWLWFIAAIFLLAAGAARCQTSYKPLILGVHPYLPHDELVSRFTPLADCLGRAIGRRIEVRVIATYDEHVEAVGGKRFMTAIHPEMTALAAPKDSDYDPMRRIMGLPPP
jgi:ABC-type phosphate/phosphonate transport system substrate-binding protein